MNGRTNSSDITINEVVVQEGVSIPLEAPTSFSGTSGDGTATITWTDPVNKYANPGGELVSDWSHDIVVRKQGSAPSSPSDGVQVLQTTSRDQVVTEPYVDTGLTNDQEYYYSVYAYNQFGLESDALVGSVVPTSFGEINFVRITNVDLEVPSSDSTRMFTASNDITGYIFSSGTMMGDYSSKDKKIDSNLTLSNYQHSPYYSFNTYSILENNVIIFGATDTEEYNEYIIRIDGNSVLSQIKKDSGIAVAADANHQAIYAETRSGSVTRYDTNLVSTSVSSTRSYVMYHPALDNNKYAMFNGYSDSNSTYSVGYTYDISGTKKQFNTPLCQGYASSSSNCDEYMLVFGGSTESNDRVDSNKCYAISSDIVVQQISDLPDVFMYGQECNIQGHKLGVVIHDHLTSNYQVWQIAYYDKRLTFQNTLTSGFLSYIDECQKNIRVGNYLIFRTKSNQIGYNRGDKYIAIYENP